MTDGKNLWKSADDMSNLEALVLGVVQGLTEFLPVSSTAHLRIVPAICGWQDPGAAYSAVIQCGTLAAVCAALRRDIAGIARGCLAGLRAGRPLANPESRLALMIVVGTVPIVAAGLACKRFVHGEARRLDVICAALLGATVLMAAAELASRWRAKRHGSGGRDGIEQVRWADSLAMGIAQALALVPGASRSGVTISVGMLAGLDRRTAARFSFLLSLPAVAAAAVLEAWERRHEILGTGSDVAAVVIGTLAAGLVGYASIRWLLRMLTGHTLWPFIAYRLALVAILGWLMATDWHALPAAAR